MWVIILIVIVIAVFIFLKDDKSGSTPRNNKQRQTQTVQPKITGYFEFTMPLSEHDSQNKRATFDDEKVYFDYGCSVGTEVIGSYKKSSDSLNAYIFLDKDGREIGSIDNDNYIFISRLAIYDNYLKMYGKEGTVYEEKYSYGTSKFCYKAKYPVPSIDLVAEAVDWGGGKGVIYDAKTNGSDTIGQYKGNKIGAACAFCAITSELHMDTEYSKFLADWEKIERVDMK